ncbi:MAG TPA: STAS domain-containing protein [Solirubrobacteraceae bacterium]|jgi:stage II sporulation protein AA (anti-sigma F factor antagonist)
MTDLAPQTGSTAVLQIRRSLDERGVILSLDGELDLSTAPEFERELVRALGEDPGRVLVDLSQLAFMDSTGLELIVRAGHDAQLAGIELCLRGGSRQVQRLFELTGILDRLTFER